MKAIVLSVRPQWCEKIASGEKTIEVRKSAPKEVPFKAYVYVTKDKPYLYGDMPIKEFYLDNGGYKGGECNGIKLCNGKVIGEFICDRIDEYKYVYCDHPEIGYPVGSDCGDNWYDIDDEDLQKACLTEEEFKRYGNGKPLYGWHISDLKIYDKPKELSEFKTGCNGCKERDTYHCKFYCYGERPLTRPPQSYMYVEELGE